MFDHGVNWLITSYCLRPKLTFWIIYVTQENYSEHRMGILDRSACYGGMGSFAPGTCSLIDRLTRTILHH